MHNVIEGLLSRIGRYAGHGIDHRDQPFHAELVIDALPGRQGVSLRYLAHGIDGTVIRDERGWIAHDDGGRLALWAVHARGHGVQKHRHRPGALPEGVRACHVFAVGDAANAEETRIEVAFDLWPDGGIGYRLAAGAPGASFSGRSAVRMDPVMGSKE